MRALHRARAPRLRLYPPRAVHEETQSPDTTRRSIIRDGIGVGLATATYGLAFGAAAVTKGFTRPQAAALSSLMFTGGSQFAFITVIGAGGTIGAALLVTWLLGARNTLYAARLADILPEGRLRRFAAAQLVIDESMAMSVTRKDRADARLGFWATGLSVFVFWNTSTIAGAFAVGLVDDPNRYGLDAAFPAAFLALIWPQLRGRPALVTAVVAAVLAGALIPLAPAGVPILGTVLAAVVGDRVARRQTLR